MPSIAELLLAKAQQQGQMWRGIGQDIASVPASIAQAQAQARRADLEKMQVDEAKQNVAGEKLLDTALQPVQPQGPTEQGQPPMPPTHPYLDDQGLVDPTKVQQLFNNNGMAHIAPRILKTIDDQNTSVTNYQKSQRQAKIDEAIMHGRTAQTALDLMDNAGMDFSTATQHAAESPVKLGLIKPEDFQSVIAQGAQLPPDQQRGILTSLVKQADRLAPTKTLAEGAEEIGGVSGSVLARNAPKPTAPTRASIALQASGGDPNAALDLMNPPKEGSGPEQELDAYAKSVGKQRGTDLTYQERQTYEATKASAANAAAQTRHAAERDYDVAHPTTPQTIADVTLTPQQKRIAADVAQGIMSFAQLNRLYPARGATSPGSAVKQAIYLEARDINPEFSPVAFETGQKLFSDPAIRQRMAAIDSLSPIVSQINTLMQKSGNTDLPTLNRLLQAGKFQFGDTTVTDLRQLQTLLGDEVGNALGLGSGSDLKTRLGLDLVNPTLGPKQFATTMQQLQSVLGARRQVLAQMMGPYGAQTNAPAPNSTAPKEGTKGTVNGRAATWKTVNGKTGWYAD